MTDHSSDGQTQLWVWTDGACKGNPGPGGWAWSTKTGPSASGGDPHTTNQRMEVLAAFKAVETLTDGPIRVVSDSTYVVSCFNKGWYKGWHARGWKNASKQPVANRDLWEPFIDLVLSRGDVEFQWVKGHSGDRMNERVDVMAVAEAERYAAEVVASGVTISSKPADGRIPEGWLFAAVGQRQLTEPDRVAAQTRLAEIFAAHRTMHPDMVVLTGMRRGAERLAADAAHSLGIPVVAVLPWPDPAARWPPAERTDFDRAVKAADKVVTLESKVPKDRDAQRLALRRRNGWMARSADGAIVVHDGTDAEGVELLGQFSKLDAELWDLDLSL